MTVNVKLFERIEDVAADAGPALDRAHQGKLYDRIGWIADTEAHCGLPGTPLVARARNAAGTAWLFLQRTSRTEARALASWYTLDFGLVAEGDVTNAVGGIPLELSGLAHIGLQPLSDPGPIADAFRAAGWRVFVAPATTNWFVRPQGDFEDYWQSRPGKLRSTVKRKGKKAGLDIRIHRAFDEAAWDDYRAIYARSWKPEEGSWSFMRAFAEAEGAAGALRLGIAYKDGEPVAAQLWHVENGRATIHKLAYAESAKDYSPGSILGEAMFRHVIDEDRPEIIDYGTGDEPYKADWMDERRPLYRLDLYNPRRPAAWLPLLRKWLSGLVRRRAHG